MSRNHYIKKCACGVIVEQCKCMASGKQVIEVVCPTCEEICSEYKGILLNAYYSVFDRMMNSSNNKKSEKVKDERCTLK